MNVVDQEQGEDWILYQGDSAEVLRGIPTDSIHLGVTSIPFSSLFCYSPSDRDAGNSTTEQFWQHLGYITREWYRATMPGRDICVHVQQLPLTLGVDGVIGLRDFRGETIRHFIEHGYVYHGEAVVQKNPQQQAIRTHSKSLLFVQLHKDSSWMRPAFADYVLIFRKPGENPVPVLNDLKNEEWIEWAKPIWLWEGIRESDTLNVAEGREETDERHICLARGSLVLTRQHGYIPIETVETGDSVLTHLGRWMPVTSKRCNGVAPIVRTTAQGVADLRTTPDHLLWTRQGSGHYAKRAAQAGAPQWLRADATIGSYVNLKLPPIEDSALTDAEWWIVGRWLGDGHRGGHHRSGKRGGLGQFLISCAHREAPALIARLGEHAGHAAEVTATQVALVGLRAEVRGVLDRCGNGAANKRLPGEAVTLNPEKAAALLDGYLSADGHYVERYNRRTASSVSRALLLGMALVAQRAKGVVASVYAGRVARDGAIQGRAVRMSQDWVLGFRESPGYRPSGWVAEDGAWKKVRKVDPAGDAEVWDIAVDGDASFTAEGAIVHNCPLQLTTIERCIRLWSNPGETVIDPFVGLGSVPYQAVKLGRRGIGIELKESYYRSAVRNLRRASAEKHRPTLFDAAAS